MCIRDRYKIVKAVLMDKQWEHECKMNIQAPIEELRDLCERMTTQREDNDDFGTKWATRYRRVGNETVHEQAIVL